MSTTRWLDQDLAAAFLGESTTSFRLAAGPGFWVERYGESVLISRRPEIPPDQILDELRAWSEKANFSPSRIFCRQLVRSPGEKDTPVLLEGDATAPPTEVVLENGLSFEVDFHSGYNPGLFCDQRANRAYLRELRPRRLLNTFAHTCAFSVAASSAGAETTSVDISKAFLQRGRRNFDLNGLPLEKHRFVAEDVPTYLRRLARRGELFDAIILDPPTFGRGGSGKTFRMERDFAELLSEALKLAQPRAALLLSTNFSEWNEVRLVSGAKQLAPTASFRSIPSPPDFFGKPPSSAIWMFV